MIKMAEMAIRRTDGENATQMTKRLIAGTLRCCDRIDWMGRTLREIEMIAIIKALNIHDWNQTRAAAMLGISQRMLRYKIRQYRALGLKI